MPLLTVRDGARSVVRRVEEPTALDALCPCTPPVPYERGWTLEPDGRGLALVSPAGIRRGIIAPGHALALGDVTLALEPEDSTADALAPVPAGSAGPRARTDRLLTDSRPPLILDLPDGRSVRLGARTVTIGKDPQCDLVLSDPSVSRVHCRIVPTRAGWEVHDAGSTNGTRVGEVLVHAALLAPGVSLVLGRTRIVCRAEADERVGEGQAGAEGTVLVGASPAMEQVRQSVSRYAPQAYPVLIHGETGSGKEIVARMLHERSPRVRGPFVAINAATIAPELVESELFGHERGAFTGAAGRRRGVFEEASGGTLFLDEIGELPPGQQAKLLRVLETREVRRVGAEGTVRVDVRVVCATHRDLAARAAEGHFRLDLLYRLDTLRIVLPPLRERLSDVPALARHLLGRVAAETGRNRVLEDAALAALMAHDWPGNVRELYGVLCRAAVQASGERIGPEHLDMGSRRGGGGVGSGRSGSGSGSGSGMAEGGEGRRESGVEWRGQGRELCAEELRAVLESCGGNLSRAARAVGLARSTFRERLERAGIRG